jgi:hypothetical protein
MTSHDAQLGTALHGTAGLGTARHGNQTASLVGAMRAHIARSATNDPAALARSFLQKNPRRKLEPLLVREFIRLLRDDTRDIENRVEALIALEPQRWDVTGGDGVALLADVADLLDRPYRTGSGEDKMGRDMTVADWTARRAMLVAHRAGVDRAIAVCDAVIAALTDHDANSLRDLEERHAA